MIRLIPDVFKAMARVLVAMGLAGCVAAQNSFEYVDAAGAGELLKDPNVFLLDVRTPGENASARIAGDTLVPLQVLEQQLGALPKDKKRPVLVYCRSGNRSAAAARILAKNGHETIFNLKDGVMGWQKAGYPVVTGPRAQGQ